MQGAWASRLWHLVGLTHLLNSYATKNVHFQFDKEPHIFPKSLKCTHSATKLSVTNTSGTQRKTVTT